MPVNIEDIIGKPAIFQILSKKRGRTEEEKTQLAMKIETSCKRFNNNNGRLSIDEFYNVIKLQNGVEVSKDEIRRLVADLDMDKDFKISIKVVVIKQLVREKIHSLKNFHFVSGIHDRTNYFRVCVYGNGQK